MAKYKVTHSCGHEIEHQLFGKTSGFSGRDSKLEWLEHQPCLACKAKADQEHREKQNREAAEANSILGCVKLEGSEKQVLWAETLRHRTLSGFKGIVEKMKALAEKNLLAEFEVCRTVDWLTKEITDSQWWIDTIGKLQSQEGLAPLFAMVEGKHTPASEKEILRHVLLESPYITEEGAKVFHLDEELRSRIAARAATTAKAENLQQIEARKPAKPQILQDWIAKYGKLQFNWKFYSGNRVFVNSQEIKLTPEQTRELQAYSAAWDKWDAEKKALA